MHAMSNRMRFVLSAIHSDFLDLAPALALCPGLIFLEGFEDGRRVLVREDEDGPVICRVVLKGEDILPPTNGHNVRFRQVRMY